MEQYEQLSRTGLVIEDDRTRLTRVQQKEQPRVGALSAQELRARHSQSEHLRWLQMMPIRQQVLSRNCKHRLTIEPPWWRAACLGPRWEAYASQTDAPRQHHL